MVFECENENMPKNIEIMRNKKIDIPLILNQLKFCDCKIHKPNMNLITSAKKA